MEFANSFNVVVVGNTFLKNDTEKLLTFKSCGNFTNHLVVAVIYLSAINYYYYYVLDDHLVVKK